MGADPRNNICKEKKIEALLNKLPIDEALVRAAYKFMLRREPDSVESVESP